MKTIYQPVLTPEEWETGNFPSFGAYENLERAKEDFPNREIEALNENDIEEPTYFD